MVSTLTLAGDLDTVTELAGLALDLDTVMKVLLESGTVEDTITRREVVVDNEFVLGSGLSSSGLNLHEGRETSVSLLRRWLSKAVLATDHDEELEAGMRARVLRRWS